MRLFIEYVFDTADERIEGLQGKTLNEAACALFVYDSIAPRSFHMRNVPTDLYLSAVDNGGCVSSVLMGSGEPGPFHAPAAALFVESRKEIPVDSKLSIEGEVLVIR